MEHGQKRAIKWIVIAVGLVVVGAIGWQFFAPKPSQMLDEAAPTGATLLRAGEFRDGETFHKASGSVRLLQDADGYVLRFEGYEATPGPDVYFYLTKSADASTVEAVEGEGIRILTEGARGQATLRGAFNVRLPEGVDPTSYGGIVAWCDAYNVLFGSAALT